MFLFVKIFVPLIIAVIMFTVGTTTTLNDFKLLLKKPKAIGVGVFLQLLSLPFFAILFALVASHVFSLPKEVVFGIVILGACPGGGPSNLLTHIGRGEVPLSILLTSSLSLLNFITLPLVLTLASYFVWTQSLGSSIGFLKLSMGLFLFSTVPLILGFLFRHFWPSQAIAFEIKSKPYILLFLAFVIFGALYQNYDLVSAHAISVLPVIFFFNLVVLVVAYLVAVITNMTIKEQIAIVFECGLQNSGVAILIALNLLKIEEAAVPAALYTFSMYFTAGLYYFSLKFKNQLPSASSEAQ